MSKNNSRTVFVTNKSSAHDYTFGMRYGALLYVTQGNYPIFKTERLTEEVIDKLVHSSEDDFLLISGSSTIAALCMMVWMSMHNKVNLLLWDRGENSYVLRVVERQRVRMEIEQTRDRLEAMRAGR